MEKWSKILDQYLQQSQSGDLKTSSYPKEWSDLRMRISFGMGGPARIPWIAFLAPGMEVSNGYYPVYLFYKEQKTLILAYGISETNEFTQSWSPEVTNSTTTITAHFNQNVPRYGDSYVFKSYKIGINEKNIKYFYSETNKPVTEVELESDLNSILEYYKRTTSVETTSPTSTVGQGLFYMEKQLEEFIIDNWDKTELGERYSLIVEDGELVSQQYRTDIGSIDILAKDKKTNNYVVIELKRNQTSDDTIGQVNRYRGWIKKEKGDKNVKGIIIAGSYDKRLEYALEVIPDVELYIYEVKFNLKKIK